MLLTNWYIHIHLSVASTLVLIIGGVSIAASRMLGSGGRSRELRAASGALYDTPTFIHPLVVPTPRGGDCAWPVSLRSTNPSFS